MSWKPSAQEVSHFQFEHFVSTNQIAILHVWAPWNAYDIPMDQMLTEVAVEYRYRVIIGSIDVDDPEHWARLKKLGAINVPALVVFVNGVHLETITGLISKVRFEKRAKQWLSSGKAS
jgi:thioredoxin-like negative regulator of GroEL